MLSVAAARPWRAEPEGTDLRTFDSYIFDCLVELISNIGIEMCMDLVFNIFIIKMVNTDEFVTFFIKKSYFRIRILSCFIS